MISIIESLNVPVVFFSVNTSTCCFRFRRVWWYKTKVCSCTCQKFFILLDNLNDCICTNCVGILDLLSVINTQTLNKNVQIFSFWDKRMLILYLGIESMSWYRSIRITNEVSIVVTYLFNEQPQFRKSLPP